MGKESAARMEDSLKSPKAKPLCSGPNMALEIGVAPIELWGRDVRYIQFTFEFLISKNC